MSHRLSLVAGLAAAGLLALVRPTYAADLDYGYGDAPPPVAEEKVEFGSGWYIRGDLGVTQPPSMRLSVPSYPTTSTDLTAVPDAPTPLIGSGSKAGYVASLGGGYQFNNWFRSDVIVDFHQPIAARSKTGIGQVFCPTGITSTGTVLNGACTGTYSARLDSFDALVNGYIDLGTWNRVTPYVGAGVGVSFGHYHDSATYVQVNGKPYDVTFTYNSSTYYGNYDRADGVSYQTLAWALMAGFSYDVFDHTKVDIGYRYLNLGTIPFGSGNLVSQEVRAGLRYMVDD